MAIKAPSRAVLGARALAALPALLLSTSLWASCNGMVLHAHRGAPANPENSLSGVLGVIAGPWNGAEVDLQQLRGGRWVLHHDLKTGRTTTVNGQPVNNLDETAWREVRLKQRDGKTSREAPPFLSDITERMSPLREKILNAEIKQQGSSCGAVHQLVGEMRQALPNGNWFLTAINRNHLSCARQIDPTGYYGLIVLDPRSLASQSSRGRQFMGFAESPRLDRQWLERLRQEVRPPVGIHIDVVSLNANPGVFGEARQLDMPVFTYSLSGDRDHIRALKTQIERQRMLPSGAIIDGDPVQFCRQLGFDFTPDGE